MPPMSPPDPPLTDGVVRLRTFTLDDIPAVTAACQDPDIARWTAMVPSPYTEDDARSWIMTHREGFAAGTDLPLAIVDAATGELLGACGLHQVDHERGSAEIGYWVAAHARRRGAASRAVALLTRWAIEE